MRKGATEIHTGFDMMVDSFGTVHIRNPETKTPESIESIELANPHVELIPVRDGRSGKIFDPPTTHLGRPIVGNGPASVASLTISYLGQMLTEASKLPAHD